MLFSRVPTLCLIFCLMCDRAISQTQLDPNPPTNNMSDWSILVAEIPDSEREDLLDTLQTVSRLKKHILFEADESFVWDFATALHSSHELVEKHFPTGNHKLPVFQKTRITNKSFRKESKEIDHSIVANQLHAADIGRALKWSVLIAKHIQMSPMRHRDILSVENVQNFRNIVLKISAVMDAHPEWKDLSQDVSALAWISSPKKEI